MPWLMLAIMGVIVVGIAPFSGWAALVAGLSLLTAAGLAFLIGRDDLYEEDL